MKNILTSLVLSSTFVAPVFSQISFEQHYGTPSKLDAFSAIAPTADGGYLLAGTTANFGSQDLDILLIKTDAGGSALWTKTWGGPGNDGAAALMRAEVGSGYILAGHTAGANGDRDFLALRLDENGEELWRVVRGGSDDDAATAALALSNGDFFVAGNTIPSQFSGQQTLVMRIAANGSVVWENIYGIGSFDEVKGAVTTADGGFILATNRGNLLKTNGQGFSVWQKSISMSGLSPFVEFFKRDFGGNLIIGGANMLSSNLPFLFTLNEDGEIVTNFSIKSSVPLNSWWIDDAIGLSNGQYALVFRGFFTPSLLSTRPGLALFDPTADTILWYAPYTDLNMADIQRPNQLLKTTVGDNILLVGSTSSDEEGVNAFLSIFSYNGTQLLFKYFGVTDLADNETARKVLQTPDGGYLVLANKALPGKSLDMWLIKTDANGNVQWDVAYGFPDADNLIGIDAAPDGGYVAVSYNDESIRVSKINSIGQAQWLKKFEVGLGDGTFGVRVAPNNECLLVFPSTIVVGTTVQGGSTLMKLNAQGDSLWAKHYPDLGPDYENPYLYGLAFAPDNRYALCGGVETPPNNELWPVIALTDADGNLLWSKTYDPDESLAIMIDINSTSDNGFVTHGIQLGNVPVSPHVIRTDANGNKLWTAKPNDPDASFLFPWSSAHAASTGHTFLFEEKRYPGGNKPTLPERDYAGSVQKLSVTGQLICEGNFGLGRAGSFRGGAITADGGAVAVGTASFNNSTDAWLVKMNPDCTVGFQTPLTPPFGMQLSPNPSSGTLVLEIESEHSGAVSIEVLNVAGQKVLQWRGEKTGETFRQHFDLSQSPDGVYFVWVQLGEKARALSWVKQH